MKKGKVSPYSSAERGVPKLIAVLRSQPAGDVSHKPGGRLPLLSAKPAVTLATVKTDLLQVRCERDFNVEEVVAWGPAFHGVPSHCLQQMTGSLRPCDDRYRGN